jgi:pyruvate formate lyase activating enzyme
MENNQHIFDRTACIKCGKCTEKCYAMALELVGKEMTVNEVIDEVMKDKAFYDSSGGGMTISGGEPMMQFEFTQALLQEAKERGLHTCLDTCGFTQFEKYKEILENVDIFLYDLKETVPERHQEYTGVPLKPILENLKQIDMAGGQIILRCPLIPGLNDRDEHFDSIAEIANGLKNLLEINLMAYHPLGESKIKRLGLDSKFNSKKFAARDECEKLRQRLQAMCQVKVNL